MIPLLNLKPDLMPLEQDFNDIVDAFAPLEQPKTESLDMALKDPMIQTAEGNLDTQTPANTAERQVTLIPEEITSTLDNLTQEMTVNVNQINQLENTLQDLSVTITRLNQMLGVMDNRLLGLAETVDGLSQDLSNVKKVFTEEDIDLTGKHTGKIAQNSLEQPIMYNAPDYTVHAIIPGRAWLRGLSGQIITVTEGDTVGDYGKIAMIDPNNGLVRTSSGITFR